MPEPDSKFVTMKEAAGLYGYCVSEFRKKACRGEVPGAFKMSFPNCVRPHWRVNLKKLREEWGV